MNGSVHQGQLVAFYRKLKGWSQQDLADALQVDIRTVQRIEKQAMIKNPERRRFLVALLGIPASKMGLDDIAQHLEKASTLFNDDPMTFLEDQLHTRWQMQLIGGPGHAGYGLERWQHEVQHFATSARATGWRQRALTVLCMSYQLKGSVAGDLMQYDTAQLAYRQSLQLAKELGDTELIAATFVRQGITFMRQDNPCKAITYFTGALDAMKGQGLPVLRGNVFQLLSEAHAKVGSVQECWRCIGMANEAIQQRTTVKERSYRLCNMASIHAHKAVDALLLHDYERALSLFEKSLNEYNPTHIPGRARLLARKAEAYYGSGIIDACTATAEESLLLARSVAANNTITRIHDLYTALIGSQWKRERSVARLGALLAIR